MGVDVQGIFLSDAITRKAARLLAMIVTEKPHINAVSDAIVKEWLRIDPDDTSNNVVINAVAGAATQAVETHTNRAFITQKRQCTFSAGMSFRLVGAPFGDIVAVEAINDDGTFTAIPSTGYTYSEATGIVDTTSWQTYGVRIEYECGYGEATTDVPTTATLAMMRYVSTNYEIREDGTIGASTGMSPTTWKQIANAIKIYTI
jgi:uncharacterized phiE125 gp8 family phage protein